MPVGESKYQALDGDRGTEMTSTTIAEPSKAVTYSLDEAIDWVGFGRLQLQLGVLLGLSWLSESMEVMLLSLLSPALLCDWRISPWRQATVSTAVFVGMTCGQLYWGRFADRHGRKPTMLVSGFFLAYFGFLSSFAPTFIWITILRCLVGFFIGSVQQVVTLFTEFLPTNQRGKSLIIIQLFWTSGAILEVLLAMVVVPTLGWRWLLATSSIPLVLFALLSPLLVESPRYHAACGRPELAQATMDLLAAKNGRALPPGHLETSSANDESRGHFPDLLSRQNRRTSVLLWTLWMMVTFCYYGIIMLATELLKMPEDQMCSAIDEPQQERVCQAHCTTLTKADYLDVLWTALSELPGLLLTVLLVDKIGRKKTIAGGLLIFILSLSVPLFCVHSRMLLTASLGVGRAAIASVFLGLTIYTPEVYPTHLRATGNGTCGAFGRIGAITTPLIAQVLIHSSVRHTAAVYATSAALGIVATLLLPYETAGRAMVR